MQRAARMAYVRPLDTILNAGRSGAPRRHAAGAVALMKVDVQGFEPQVFEGMHARAEPAASCATSSRAALCYGD